MAVYIQSVHCSVSDYADHTQKKKHNIVGDLKLCYATCTRTPEWKNRDIFVYNNKQL